jgi:dipeptidyl aminopeptidase/acylaminoacyl peptidase
MALRAVAIILACAVVSSVPWEAGAEPVIREVRPAVAPAYDQYARIKAYAPDPEEYARAVNDRAFVMERITYRSGGLDVFAYLYRPASPPKDRKLPTVVLIRGGYVREEFVPEVLMPGSRLAHEGFLVIAPALRGSAGAPGRDEMGGADLDDVFNIVPVLEELGYADTGRVFLYGESRGGIMSLLAARRGFPARAIATRGAITDLGKYLEADASARKLAATIWPDLSAREAEILESRSAIRWPEKINAPLLLMHGGADPQVSPLHAIELAAALQRLGKPYELKVFYGENHIITGRRVERDAEAIRWFKRFDAEPR